VSKTRLAVYDTETTGAEETDQVCELGIVTLIREETKKRGVHVYENHGRWSSLIRPTCSMTVFGRAAHHISDDELNESWTMSELLVRRGLPEFMGDVVGVAHNLEFDSRMMCQSGVPKEFMPKRNICTWKCAQHLYPDAPRYSNQILRYWLGIIVPQMLTLPPHRALPDAVVTAGIVTAMLASHTVEELIELTSKPVLLKTCHMGEHAGKPWKEVDIGFLRWIVSKGPRRTNPKGGRDIGFDDDIMYTVKHWIEVRSA
jgi:exodeoxyribonuclease X